MRNKSPYCSRCKTTLRASQSRYCKSCKAAYMKEWRKTHPLTPDQRIQHNKLSYKKVYAKRGKPIPKDCKYPELVAS